MLEWVAKVSYNKSIANKSAEKAGKTNGILEQALRL